MQRTNDLGTICMFNDIILSYKTYDIIERIILIGEASDISGVIRILKCFFLY